MQRLPSNNAPELLAQQFRNRQSNPGAFPASDDDASSEYRFLNDGTWTWHRVQNEIKNFLFLRTRAETGTSEPGDSRSKSVERNINRFFPKYRTRLQINFFTSLLLLNVFFNLIIIVVALLETNKDDRLKGTIFLNATSMVVHGMFLVLTYVDDHLLRPRFNRTLASTTVLLTMFIVEYGDVILQFDSHHLSRIQRIRPVIFFIIANHILVPFPTRKYSFIASIALITVETSISILQRMRVCKCPMIIVKLTVSDTIFYLYAALFGLYISRLLEVITRRAFENHFLYIRSKFNLFQKQQRQEDLLSSCFPKHLIEDVKADLKNSILETNVLQDQSAFKKLYVEQSKNVSILYADIVNSMSLTSSLSPKELVDTLNQLFDSFDQCAERNNCLRIKLLGDCYYCVSGMARTDSGDEGGSAHATNSVTMGLEMIDIIAEVRRAKNVPVNMRIGVHSGMVLSGIIGLHKWQFDIWSEDAILASAMEHDGVPGAVHVTSETLSLLPDSFRKNLKIEKRVTNGTLGHVITRRHPTPVKPVEVSFSKSRTSTKNLIMLKPSISSQVNAFIEAEIEQMPLSFKSNVFKNIYGIHPFLLTFQASSDSIANDSLTGQVKTSKWKLEKEFAQLADDFFIFYLAFSLLLWGVVALVKNAIVPRYRHSSLSGILFSVSLILICFGLFYSYSRYSTRLSVLKRRIIWFVVTTMMMLCSMHDIVSFQKCSEAPTSDEEAKLEIENNQIFAIWTQIPYLWTYTNCVILAMTGVSIFIRINVWLKFILHFLGFGAFSALLLQHCSVYQKLLPFHESGKDWIVNVGFDPTFSHLYYVFMIVVVLCIVDRQIEYIFRLDFKLAKRLEREDQESRVMGDINDILLYNIIPANVARRELNPHDPYCEQYDHVAVMFASIPNFSDFYSENNLNDNGIKCLQLLNEIICDFDQHLTEQAFVNRIEKIKTIGSTYMAASGLCPGKEINQTDQKTRRSHVLTMLRFAIALMKTLGNINQNALQEFKLRVGIAVGPAIAGVVGPSKPQYDIWGDTVNVASRMDSTGIMGRIQLTEEAARLLEECGDHSDEFTLEPRGVIPVKGKGDLMTFLAKTPFDFDEKVSTKI